MKDGIHLEIATAGGTVYDDMVSYAELPFSGGSVGVLRDHAPMLGVGNIVHNEVTLLVRTAERAEDIDLPRAEAAEQRARERLGDKGGPWDRERAQTALHRALARQAAVRMMKK